MPLWAQIDVAMRSHPKLFGRPDSDFRLWTCLLLHAKEHAPLDGIVRGLSAADLKAMFGIKAPTSAVQAALQYFASCPLGPMIKLHQDGAIELLGWEESGNAYDEEAERQAWRDRKRKQRDKSRNVTRDIPGQSRPCPAVVPPLEVEVEVEVEVEGEVEKEQKQPGDAAASPRVPSEDESAIARLEAEWPPVLIANLRSAIASTRASGKMALGPWRGFLARASQFDKPRREAAAQLYLERALGTEGKGESYLIGMMRKGAGSEQHVGAPQSARPKQQGSFNPGASDEHFESMGPGGRIDMGGKR